MSYQFPSRFLPRQLRGLGAIQYPKAYFVALVEDYNVSTHTRRYSWTQPRYLDFWGLNSWQAQLPITSASGRLGYIWYAWTDQGWKKTGDDTTKNF